MRKLILCAGLALASGATLAAAPIEPYVKKLNPQVPSERAEGTVVTTITVLPPERQSTDTAVTVDAGAPGLPGVAPGLPMVPASGATGAGAALPSNIAAPSGAEPVVQIESPGVAAAQAAAQPGQAPGVPAPVYRTMSEAAQAGLDPLAARPSASADAQPEPAREPVHVAMPPIKGPSTLEFDVREPRTWLRYAQAHPLKAATYGLPAMATVVLLLMLARRRRDGADE